MNTKRFTLLILHVISLVFLALGLIMDILKIDITASFFIDIKLFNESRSVLGTLQSLWVSGNYLPLLLIFVFGVLVPAIKSIAVFYMLFAGHISPKWHRFVILSGKWAMADVFALSIFIAFLGAKAMANTSATLEPGFYFFVAYVLMSAFIVGFLQKINPVLPAHQA